MSELKAADKTTKLNCMGGGEFSVNFTRYSALIFVRESNPNANALAEIGSVEVRKLHAALGEWLATQEANNAND